MCLVGKLTSRSNPERKIRFSIDGCQVALLHNSNRRELLNTVLRLMTGLFRFRSLVEKFTSRSHPERKFRFSIDRYQSLSPFAYLCHFGCYRILLPLQDACLCPNVACCFIDLVAVLLSCCQESRCPHRTHPHQRIMCALWYETLDVLPHQFLF